MSDAAGSKTFYKVFIRGSAEAVWRELTKTDELQKAMFNAWLEVAVLQPSARFAMRSPSRKTTSVVGEVLEVTPPTRYVHTMRFTTESDPAWKVIHDIRPVDGGVEYQMTLVDLPVGTRSAKQAAQGMKFIAENLKSIVETGKPTLLARVVYPIFGLMEAALPKAAQSKNWPV